MPRRCSICNHPKRTAIDNALVSGTSVRDIAGQYGVSKSAVYRHKKHIPEALTKAQAAEEAAQADDLLGEIRRLQGKASGILAKAEGAGDLPTALRAIREARECLKLLAQLEGELWQRHELRSSGNPFEGLSTDELRRIIAEDMPN